MTRAALSGPSERSQRTCRFVPELKKYCTLLKSVVWRKRVRKVNFNFCLFLLDDFFWQSIFVNAVF